MRCVDVAGDQGPPINVDLISLYLSFDPTMVDYDLLWVTDPAHPFPGTFRLNANLLNLDTSSIAQEPSFFLDPGLSDTNADGLIDRTDLDKLLAHLQDPLALRVQDLVCALRASGITPHRYVPEPGASGLPGTVALLLALAGRRARAGRRGRSSSAQGSGSIAGS